MLLGTRLGFGTGIKVFEFEKNVPKPHLQGFKMTKIKLKPTDKKHPIFQNIKTKTFDKTKIFTQHCRNYCFEK